MSDYLLAHGTRETPQSEPMRGDQVANSAGGYAWEVDDWTRLRRFLILGSEGGSYYAAEGELTFENATVVRKLAQTDGVRLVEEVVAISESGRAPKNDPALYALAAAISLGDRPAKRAAAEALPRVARIGTHLYHFVAYAETMRGWGRTLRWAVSNWYRRNPEQLALQAVKYRQRDGWTHRDLLRLAHPKATAELAPIFDWITHGQKTLEARVDDAAAAIRAGEEATVEYLRGDLPVLVEAYEAAQRAKTPAETADLVARFGLPREALQSDHLNDPAVWRALLEKGMPTGALVRNLATMTRNGVLADRAYVEIVAGALADQAAILASRIHPLAILVALRTYASGQGFRSSNSWNPIPDVTDALDEAFYLAFDNVEPTGKRHLLALDVSGSMATGQVAGSPLTPREASVAMALVTLHAEPSVEVVGFTGGLVPLGLSRRQRLDDAVRSVSNLPFDRTDCAQPMLYALQDGRRQYDAFVLYTDSETWVGSIHPKQALDKYREMSGIPARSAVVGMVANGFTIADPTDAGMLDVVGFDTAAPALVAEFVAGRV